MVASAADLKQTVVMSYNHKNYEDEIFIPQTMERNCFILLFLVMLVSSKVHAKKKGCYDPSFDEGIKTVKWVKLKYIFTKNSYQSLNTFSLILHFWSHEQCIRNLSDDNGMGAWFVYRVTQNITDDWTSYLLLYVYPPHKNLAGVLWVGGGIKGQYRSL